MTVIAWDGKMLAADKMAAMGGTCLTTTKIFRVDGALVGGSGSLASAGAMVEWVKKGRKKEEFPESQKGDGWCTFLVIEEGGVITQYENHITPIIFEMPFFACGSGRDFALAAMHCGKSAREAVEIASIYDDGCGNGVDVLYL